MTPVVDIFEVVLAGAVGCAVIVVALLVLLAVIAGWDSARERRHQRQQQAPEAKRRRRVVPGLLRDGRPLSPREAMALAELLWSYRNETIPEPVYGPGNSKEN